ncbi:MAG: hypothetical protein IT237_08735, partial [Bacteroidia bacterium]|nr:hypothetical protein [Bacteroidia bacterium]
VSRAQEEFDKQVYFEKITDKVISEFRLKNEKEFNRWDKYEVDGKILDIPITTQEDYIVMPNGGLTTEGTAFIEYINVNGQRNPIIRRVQLRLQNVKENEIIVEMTSVLVHGLGHPDGYIKNGDGQNEDYADEYERKIYNSGKGPKKK